MISGLSSYPNPALGNARFGNGQEAKAEEKKPPEKPAAAPEQPDATPMDAIYRSPLYQQFVEDAKTLEKEQKELDAYSKYDQYIQTGLIAGSAVSALLGQFGASALMAAYPLIKSVHATLKKLGEWDA